MVSPSAAIDRPTTAWSGWGPAVQVTRKSCVSGGWSPPLTPGVRQRQCCCPSSGADVFSRHERSSVCLLAGWRVLAWLPGRLSGLHDARRIPAGPPGASARSVRGFVGGPHSGGSKGGRVGGGVKRRDLVQKIEEM